MKAIILSLAATVSSVMAGTITCPTVTCAEQDKLKPVKADLCYKHDQ